MKYRSQSSTSRLIGFSISYDPNNLLARGFGLEHLRELLLRIARPLLRRGASLAYGGNWKEQPGNFTYELLKLISAEQEDNSLGGPDTNLPIGRLVNHLAWPNYSMVTPRIEAQWINCCRILRVTQQLAGIADCDVVLDVDDPAQKNKVLLNSAITVSAMRRFAALGMITTVPGVVSSGTIPPMSARLLLGGKTVGYSGFIPGLFEEALLSFEQSSPLYILGGFGGAAEVLANALLSPVPSVELETVWQERAYPTLLKLAELAGAAPLPLGIRNTGNLLAALNAKVSTARSALSMTLKTGLSDPLTRELMTTQDIRRASELVLTGLSKTLGLEVLPS